MKAPLTKVSLALLSAVFILACQDQGSGPVGPDGLVPQFSHNLGSCQGHHRHDEGCDVVRGRPQYFIDMTSGLLGSGLTTPVKDDIIANDFDADLSFFVGQTLTCGGDRLTKDQTGTITILWGDDHLHLGFSFMHNEAKHYIGLETTTPANWPPTKDNPAMLGEVNGEWALTNQGKNHRNDCTGAGNNITWNVTVTFVK